MLFTLHAIAFSRPKRRSRSNRVPDATIYADTCVVAEHRATFKGSLAVVPDASHSKGVQVSKHWETGTSHMAIMSSIPLL